MDRKQDQANSIKKSTDSGKVMEQGRIRKRLHNKSKGIENMKRGFLKSKAGFTLYSEHSDATKSTRYKIQKPLANSQKKPQDKKEVEELFLQQAEVVSQMQIENEVVRAAEAAGIVIPTVDFAIHEDNSGYGEFVHQEFGTPFNKRLVSSTPDPERLLEAEHLEHHGHQSSMTCPQMIPERDTTHSTKTSAVVATVANSLSEKLKAQRQKFQENQQFLQHMQYLQQYQHPLHSQQYHHPLPSQQYQHPVPSDCLYGSTMKHHDLLPNTPNDELLIVASSPVRVTKAEWVLDVDGQQNPKKNETISTFVHSMKGSEIDHSPWQTSSSMNNKVGATLPESASNADYIDDNLNAKTKILIKEAQPHELATESEPSQASENKQSSLRPSSSQPDVADSNHDNGLVLRHQPLKYGTVSNNDKYVTSETSYGLTKETLVQEVSGSAFTKSDTSAGVYFKSSTSGKTFPDSSSVENALPKAAKISSQTMRAESSRKVTSHKQVRQDKISYPLPQEVKINNIKVKKRDKDSSKENIDSSVKSKTLIGEARRVENIGASKLNGNFLKANKQPPNDDLDTTGDTCDMEVSKVFYEQKSNNNNLENREAGSALNEKINCKQRDVTTGSDTANLSQVIEILKNDVFNKVKENEVEVRTGNNESNMNLDDTITGVPNDVLHINKKQSGDDETLVELMRQYLPEADKSNINNNSNKCIDMDNNTEDADANEDTEVNVNQNRFNDEDRDYEMQTSNRPKSLQYLERMADSTLRDIACRLTLKATALRDVELRDLIDDMIFHTDAALGHEDTRLKSSQMFFSEENRKLKKRIQAVNQQLDAKERQDRLGVNALGLTNNDVLQLERKIMYLRQEKEALDDQVTTLLEEKAKWLITQQDLVRTISLKDHDILKMEEKYHAEKKVLLQSLDQATKNSQGVHYKLSVADREISNLEQCIKSKNVEIVGLKDKLKEAERKLDECERRSVLKDQDMQCLQDLVDALKIGVDHVLQAFESSCNKGASTATQRQGMENLYQMVHPEEYRSKVRDPAMEQQVEHRTGPQQHQQQQTFSSSQRTSMPKETSTKKLVVGRPIYHYNISPPRTQPHQRHHSLEDTRAFHQSQRRSRRDDELEKLPRRLTSRTLEEHNRCLSPVDKTLWRRFDHEHKLSPVLREDPYYSDSEVEINGYKGRRSSHRYHISGADKSQRQQHSTVRCSSLSPRRTEHPNIHEDYQILNDIRTHPLTDYSALRRQTIPKSVVSPEVSVDDPFSDDTYYSTLRSEFLPETESVLPEPASHRGVLSVNDQHKSDFQKGSSYDRDPFVHGIHHPRFLSVSHPSARYTHKHSRYERNVPHHSLCYKYIESSPSEHSRNLSGEDVHFVTLQPEHLTSDTRRISPRHLVSYSEQGHDFDKRDHHKQAMPYNSFLESSQGRHRSLHRPETSGTSYISPPHPDESYLAQHPEETNTYSRPSACLSDTSSFPADSSPPRLNDISISRRATRDSENLTQREFFRGTELSASLSSISDINSSSNNKHLNSLKSLNENPFSSGIASLDEKIANLQRKIDRTKAMFS